MPPKAKAKKARSMPRPLPIGEVLTDGIRKQEWVIGASIGKGGFGEIYNATLKGGVVQRGEHVIKIEPHENGPLFSELSYYRRVAKEETIDRWAVNKRLKYLPVPKYITSGSHEVGGVKYRFMVMQRFGVDIERHFRACSRFCEDTVSYLALRLLEALEFLHESEYVHADIKGSNVLTGLGREEDRVYLVDYGLAFRFNPEGCHKEYKEDPRRAHDGTVEFTSIDAHKGVCPSRRGDLEILGYCLLQWATGRLPWEDNLGDKDYVTRKKMGYKGDAAKLVRDCFLSCGGGGSTTLLSYMAEVYNLGYTDRPSYPKLRKFFLDQLGGRDPRGTLEWMKQAKPIKTLSEIPSYVPPMHRRPRRSPLQLPKMITAVARKHRGAEGEAAKPVDRPPPILFLQEEDVAKTIGKIVGKKPKLVADRHTSETHESSKSKAALEEPKLADVPIAYRLPVVHYPTELGYMHEGKEKKKVVGGGGKRKTVSRDAQRKGRGSPLKDKKTVNRREKVSGTRRSPRNRDKTTNNLDLGSSPNDKGTSSRWRDIEEDSKIEEGRRKKRPPVKITSTKRKRRRT